MRFSEQDLLLWQEATRGVRRLLNYSGPEATPEIARVEQVACRPILGGAEVKNERRIAKKPHLLPLQVGLVNRMDGASFERLKSGKICPEIKADLHGMALHEAHIFFYELILQAFAARKRCLLIITGKGFIAPSKIRAALPAWINDPDLLPLILSFAHAQPKDGGEGAFYVYLAKNEC